MNLVAKVLAAVQYTGTAESAQDVLTTIQQTVVSSSTWSLGADDGDSVTIHEVGEYGEADWVLPTGHWMVVSSGGPADFLTDDAFGRQYRTIAPVQEG